MKKKIQNTYKQNNNILIIILLTKILSELNESKTKKIPNFYVLNLSSKMIVIA